MLLILLQEFLFSACSLVRTKFPNRVIYRAQRRFIGLGGCSTSRIILLRQGSNALDNSSATHRSRPVMLSAAKHLSRCAQRCFAALSMTPCDCSHCQGLFFTIEPCLISIIGSLRSFTRRLCSAKNDAHPWPIARHKL